MCYVIHIVLKVSGLPYKESAKYATGPFSREKDELNAD